MSVELANTRHGNSPLAAATQSFLAPSGLLVAFWMLWMAASISANLWGSARGVGACGRAYRLSFALMMTTLSSSSSSSSDDAAPFKNRLARFWRSSTRLRDQKPTTHSRLVVAERLLILIVIIVILIAVLVVTPQKTVRLLVRNLTVLLFALLTGEDRLL